MSHASFYRKWRPQRFEDMVGQERITHTLQNALRSGRVAHAYLFAGHRGTGKTTTARILAKALNCLGSDRPTPQPDLTCANCVAIREGASLDVIELDAASNRGIDEIREIRDKVRLTPTQGRYKVYILDEAHMLTEPAANALLKTLEEPPENVVFVLVTTEPHKLPATILSRTQRFDFRRVSVPEIVGRLRHIAGQERFAVDDAALDLIARAADGSFRDAESVLDQLAAFADGAVTRDQVLQVLGLIEETAAFDLADAAAESDVAAALRVGQQVIESGKDVRQVLHALVGHFRDLLIVRTVREPDALLDTSEARRAQLREQAMRFTPDRLLRAIRLLSQAEGETRWATQPRLSLELALIRLARPDLDASLDAVTARLDAIEARLGGAAKPSAPPPPAPKPAPKAEPEPRAPAARAPAKPAPRRRGPQAADAETAEPLIATDGLLDLMQVRARWLQVLDEVRRAKMFTHALLVEGAPLAVSGNVVVVGLRPDYTFHVENLLRPENRTVVEAAFAAVFGVSLRLECTLADGVEPVPRPARTPVDDAFIARAAEIFGAQLESDHAD